MKIFLLLAAIAFLSSLLLTLLFPSSDDEEPLAFELDSTEERVEELLVGLLDPRPEVSETYRNQLLSLGPGVISRLIALLRRDLLIAEKSLRIERLQELLVDFGPRIVPDLLNLLAEELYDDGVVHSVRMILMDLGTAASPAILDRLDEETPAEVIEILASLGEAALPDALRLLRESPRHPRLAELFLAFGTKAVPGLTRAVQNWAGPSRLQAFKLLARLAPPESQPLFLEALREPSAEVRAHAAQALGQIASPSSLGPLLLLLEDPAEEVRLAALRSLGELTDPRARDPLRRFMATLRQQAEGLRLALEAAGALAMLNDASGFPVVEEAAMAESPSLRRAALETLERFAQEHRLVLLIRLLQDPHPGLSRKAIEALGALGSPQALSPLVALVERLPEHDPRLKSIETALVLLGEPSVPALIRLLRNSKEAVVEMAVNAIGRLRDPRAIEPMLEILKRQDVNRYAVLAYLEDLGQEPGVIGAMRRFVSENQTLDVSREVSYLLKIFDEDQSNLSGQTQ